MVSDGALCVVYFIQHNALETHADVFCCFNHHVRVYEGIAVGLTTHCAQVFGLLQIEPHDKNMCVHTYSRTCTFVSLGYRICGTESFLLAWLGTRWF